MSAAPGQAVRARANLDIIVSTSMSRRGRACHACARLFSVVGRALKPGGWFGMEEHFLCDRGEPDFIEVSLPCLSRSTSSTSAGTLCAVVYSSTVEARSEVQGALGLAQPEP